MAKKRSAATRRKTSGGRPRGAVKGQASQTILAWEDDPISTGAQPLSRPVPSLTGPLGVTIRGRKPAPREYNRGTPEFRYWAAAEALGRSATYWTSVLPTGTQWFTGPSLPITLDAGEDLNAFYDRNGLSFFHADVDMQRVFSGESPDVVSHEMGHAILDAIRPELWDTNGAEAAAFHESFGDISAILCGLQNESLRATVLAETSGALYRNSRISRVAEQLGAAIRRLRADAVDPDSLRNAVNSFFYRDPDMLPPSAPASQLSSEPHSFSRVFTSAFFEAMAGMLPASPQVTQELLQQATLDAGRLLVDAVLAAPIVPGYYSQIAAHVIEADQNRFGGSHATALKSAFVRHGVLSLEAAVGMAPKPRRARGAAAFAAAVRGPDVHKLPLPAERYGFLGKPIVVQAPGNTKRFAVASAAFNVGSTATPSSEDAVRAYLEDLFRRGRVDVTGVRNSPDSLRHPFTKKTHRLIEKPNELVLQRQCFDCGFDEAGYRA